MSTQIYTGYTHWLATQSLTKTKAGQRAVVAYWCIALPVGYILGFVFDYGYTGVWIGLLIGLSAAASLLYWRFRYISVRKLPQKADLFL